jgi:dTDP-4-dehydrorhamnose 3,5-epimerase
MVKGDKSEPSFVKETSIPGLLVIERPTMRDERGFFREVYRASGLEPFGVDFHPIQENHSKSLPGVIRAIHAENWNKLVYPLTGKLFAAVVDLRPESSAFSKVETFEFDSENPKALFIPKGLGNSICVLGDETVHYVYLVDAYWTGEDTSAVAWDDPDLNIDWPVKNPIISERDKGNPRLRDLFPEKFK